MFVAFNILIMSVHLKFKDIFKTNLILIFYNINFILS